MTQEQQKNRIRHPRLVLVIAALLYIAPFPSLGQNYGYPADNDADYYDRQYHTPVTPVAPQYHQQPRYPSDNDADYYEYYYGTSNTGQYQDDNAYYDGYYQQNPYYYQQPPQYQPPYRGQQDYYRGYGQGGYPQDNDDTYYSDPSYAPSVNQWDD